MRNHHYYFLCMMLSLLALVPGLAWAAEEPDWQATISSRGFRQFSVIDANADGETWTGGSSSYRGPAGNEAGNDDWLVTPALHLQPGYEYTVAFSARNSSRLLNSMEVKLGTGNKAAGDFATQLMPLTQIPRGSSSSYTKYSYTFTVDADQNYYIGFHDKSDPDAGGATGQLYINAIAVTKKALAQAIEPDWQSSLSNKNENSLYTIVDGDNDGRSWTFVNSNGYVRSYYNRRGATDDWLFTPGFHFTPGRLYKLSISARNHYDDELHSLEIKMGNAASVEGMTETVMPTTTFNNDVQNYSFYVNPTTDGTYYFGFHDNTTTVNQGMVEIRSIAVTKDAAVTAPAAVTALSVTSGAQGALSATISFKAPELAINGQSLSTVDKITVTRDGTLVQTIGSTAAGGQVTVVDGQVPASGFHTYAVKAYAGDDGGMEATARAFIGQDVPAAPANARLVDNGTSVTVEWDAAQGAGVNGGYVDASSVKVDVFKLVKGEYSTSVGDSITTSAAGATSATYAIDTEASQAADGTSQSNYSVVVRATAAGGKSAFVETKAITVGPSLQLPFAENLAGGAVASNHFIKGEGNDERNDFAPWQLVNNASSDGDGYSLLWASSATMGTSVIAGDEMALKLPKVSLNGASNPMLYFSYYAKAGEKALLNIVALTPDGVETQLQSIDLSKTAADGWTQASASLKQFASSRYVILKLRGVSQGNDTYIGIDDINILDQLNADMAVASVNAPASVYKGKSGNVQVTLRNYGAQPASGFKVVLTAGGADVDTVAPELAMPAMGLSTVSLQWPVAVNAAGDSVALAATVIYDGDQDGSNNTATVKVATPASPYNVATGLTAQVASGNNVELAWDAPAKPQATATVEDFESYDAFSTQLGEWTTVNGKPGMAAPMVRNVTWPGAYTSFAFIAFKSDALDGGNVLASYPGLAPHSGSQCALSPYAVDNLTDQNVLDADNWLISPELSGKQQTVTFWVTNNSYYNETFDVLYSTTTTDASSFVKITSGTADGTVGINRGTNWKQVSVEVPAGAKYFAIHQTTPGSGRFMLGIDDISYEKGAPGINDTITAYAVYRDGKRIATVAGDKPGYTDAQVENGTHVYNVTAIYTSSTGEQNESAFSNDAEVSIVVTGIDAVNADGNAKLDTSKPMFNVAGQRVGSDYRGIVVQDGIKFLRR